MKRNVNINMINLVKEAEKLNKPEDFKGNTGYLLIVSTGDGFETRFRGEYNVVMFMALLKELNRISMDLWHKLENIMENEIMDGGDKK